MSVGVVFSSEIGGRYIVGERMPPVPEENYETSWFKNWKHPKKDQKGVTVFHDLDKDRNYDLAISYIFCGEDNLRQRNPYGIFDRRGIYGKKGVLYLDYKRNDYIDEIKENIGERKTYEDAPECPSS